MRWEIEHLSAEPQPECLVEGEALRSSRICGPLLVAEPVADLTHTLLSEFLTHLAAHIAQ